MRVAAQRVWNSCSIASSVENLIFSKKNIERVLMRVEWRAEEEVNRISEYQHIAWGRAPASQLVC